MSIAEYKIQTRRRSSLITSLQNVLPSDFTTKEWTQILHTILWCMTHGKKLPPDLPNAKPDTSSSGENKG